MHKDVLALTDAEGAVGGLIFDRRVPPTIEVEHVVRLRQIEADAACPQREDEQRRFGLGILKLGNHLVPPGYAGPPMQVVRIIMPIVLEVALQRTSNLRE